MAEIDETSPDAPAAPPPIEPPLPPLPPVVVTPLLVGLATLASVACFLTDVTPATPTLEHLVSWGADFGPYVLVRGEWWRLLTCAFLHGGWVHLALNMWVLWGMGPACERSLGRGPFAFVYLASAIGGSLASLAWRPIGVSVGASGAIFGVAGAYLAFLHGLRERVPPEILKPLRQRLLMFVGINLLIGATLTFVDNAAHLGGLATGALASFLLAVPAFRYSPSPWKRLGAPMAVGASVLVVAAFGVRQRLQTAPEVVGLAALERGQQALREERFDAAKAELDRSLAASPNDPRALVARGVVHYLSRRPQEALRDLSAAIRQEDSAGARGLRGDVHLTLGNLDRAAEDFERAIRLAPRNSDPLRGLGRTRFRQGRLSDALAAFDKGIALAPDDYSLRLARARALQGGGRLDDALADLDRAVELSPDESIGHNNRAWLLRMLGRLPESLEEADRAVALKPGSAHALGTRCFTRFGLEDRAGALADCREAVRLRPEGLVDVGLVAFMAGDRKAAAEAWQEAIASGEVAADELAPWFDQATVKGSP